jgi:cleavage and polyadenylation specificity factor subunit 3
MWSVGTVELRLPDNSDISCEQVLVHGEQTAMGRLRAALQSRYKEREEDVKIHTPRNLDTLNLSFRGERVAKVSAPSTYSIPIFPLTNVHLQAIGSLASHPPPTNSALSGLLVSKDYSYTLLNPSDLRDFTGLSTSSILQRMKLAIGVGWELVRWHLEGMYGSIEDDEDEAGVKIMRVSIWPRLLLVNRSSSQYFRLWKW